MTVPGSLDPDYVTTTPTRTLVRVYAATLTELRMALAMSGREQHPSGG